MSDYDPAWADAIKSIESSGNYSAVGPATSTGDRAHGAYQVMGANVGPWTKDALGTAMTPDEFRADPEAQDAVFQHRFGGDAAKYGSPQEAASRWFTGKSVADGADAHDVLGNTGSGYVAKFNRALTSDGPTAINNAIGLRPSTGSSPMAYAAPDPTDPTQAPGALNPAPPQGALTAGGQPVAAPSWLTTLGQTLKDMAPGIAQDPAHAQVLEAAANATRPPKPVAGSWSTNYDPITGIATRTLSSTGQHDQYKYAEPRADPNDKVQWGIVGKDRFGQPIYGDEAKAAAAQAAGKPVSPDAAPDPLAGLTGQPYLDALTKSDPQFAPTVIATLQGRNQLPTGRAAQTPQGAKLVQAVNAADGTFDSGQSVAAQKSWAAFNSATAPGSEHVQIRQGNTALDHSGNLSDEIEVMKSYHDHADSAIPGVSYALNLAHNKALAGQSTPEAQAYRALQNHIENFASEKAKYLGGGIAGEKEKERILDLYDLNKSLPELRAGMHADAEDVMAKGRELQEGWRTAHNRSPLVPDFPVISPEGQAGYDRISERYKRTAAGGYVQPNNAGAAFSPPSLSGKPITQGTFKSPNGTAIPWSIN